MHMHMHMHMRMHMHMLHAHAHVVYMHMHTHTYTCRARRHVCVFVRVCVCVAHVHAQPCSLSLSLTDVLYGEQADAARVSSLVTGAGMTAALFLLLGVGFSLQLYRRRRQQILRQVPSGWTTVFAQSANAAAAGALLPPLPAPAFTLTLSA